MTTCQYSQFVVSMVVGGMLLGCGDKTQKTAERREVAGQAYDEALDAFQNRDFAGARELFTQAIEVDALHGDRIAPAHIMRAVSAAHEGDFAAAHDDLDRMEGGAPEMDQVHAARSFVFAQEGKANEARAAWNEARKFNPRVRQFE